MLLLAGANAAAVANAVPVSAAAKSAAVNSTAANADAALAAALAADVGDANAVAPAANATKVARLRVLHGCCSPHAATVAPM